MKLKFTSVRKWVRKHTLRELKDEIIIELEKAKTKQEVAAFLIGMGAISKEGIWEK